MFYQLVTNFLRFMVQYLQSGHQLFSTDLWLSSRHDNIADVIVEFSSIFLPFRYSGWRMRKDGCRVQAGNDFLGEWVSVPIILSAVSGILSLLHPNNFYLVPQGALFQVYTDTATLQSQWVLENVTMLKNWSPINFPIHEPKGNNVGLFFSLQIKWEIMFHTLVSTLKINTTWEGLGLYSGINTTEKS